MEESLIHLVDQLLEQMQDKAQPDLIEEFASAIPVEVIGNLLDVPLQDRAPLRAWSLDILGALEPVVSPPRLEQGNQAVREFIDYLTGLIAHRRAHPGNPDTDVLTRLIQGEADGEKLSMKELLHNCIFLLNAGHETTTNLIGNGLKVLHDEPAQRARLLLDAGLIKPCVEEVLRFESSNQLGNRITTEATQIGAVQLAPQSRVTLCIGAANRDPLQFKTPEQFDIGRQPNRHLAFASGTHACVGMSLARLEGQIALGRFIQRYPHYQIVNSTRSPRVRFRGFTHLPAILR